MRPTRLSEAEVATRLAALPSWTRQGEAIHRTFELATFAEAIAFVTRVAALAEAADHHPDILVQYRKVTLTLSTHDAGGLTSLDFDLAGGIDRA